MSPTSWSLWRSRSHRCPTCNHRVRTWQLEHLFAVRCRWGHTTDAIDLPTSH